MAEARAETDCELISVSRVEFKKKIENTDIIIRSIIATLSQRLRQLEKRTKLSLQKEKPTHIIDDGEIEIKTHRTEKTQDRTCPVCKTYSFSPRDDLYMNRFKACRLCYYDFIFCREDDWMSGKRPTDEQISTCLRRRK